MQIHSHKEHALPLLLILGWVYLSGDLSSATSPAYNLTVRVTDGAFEAFSYLVIEVNVTEQRDQNIPEADPGFLQTPLGTGVVAGVAGVLILAGIGAGVYFGLKKKKMAINR